VYIKVRNAYGSSAIVGDNIIYAMDPALFPAITSYAINNGAAITYSREVTLNNTCTGSPSEYIASESNTFSGATWQPYSEAPSFTLSEGYGTKRVYIKVRNAYGSSAIVGDNISYPSGGSTTTIEPTTTVEQTTTIEVTTTVEETTTTVAPESSTTTTEETTTTTTVPELQVYDYAWDFTSEADYYLDGDWWTSGGIYAPVITALPVGGHAYVPARPWIDENDDPPYGSDWAAVFARINTQAYHLVVGDITGGGFTVTGMNHPDAVYGSLYLSPTGGSGSTVMINLSPLSRSGSDGNYVYSFDLSSPCDVKIKNGPGGTWGTAQYTGTFAGAIAWVNANQPGNYAAFFGPQIGMSNTSETTFTVWQIGLTANFPAPATTTTIAEETTTTTTI
jgi:hypothetical protein